MNPFNRRNYLGPSLVAFGLLLIACAAHAQTAPRATPCSAATPTDAICVTWGAITTDSTGKPISGVTYRVQKKAGATGTYSNMATGITATQFYATNLSIGTHFFRVYAACASCTVESDPSNEASGTATAVSVVPSTPVIVIAATINANGPPTYRVIQSVTLKPNEIAFVAPASMRPLFANR